jgi:DNA-binding transcriptional MocR family regulator
MAQAVDFTAQIQQQLAVIARYKQEGELRGQIRRLEHAYGRADDECRHADADTILDELNELDQQLADFLNA